MGQTWERVLFAHWRVDPDVLRPHVPEALGLETFDGSAWLGITPLHLSGLRFRGTLPVPVMSSFEQVNVRTYVRAAGMPGVWLFSLDCSSRLAVEAARRLYKLPYHRARITVEGDAFEAARLGAPAVVFSARYRPAGPVEPARPGSLEEFLTERYCLYAGDGRYRAETHHAPWPLRPAEAQIELATIAPVELEGEPVCHYTDRLDVVVWGLEPIP